MRDNVPSDSEKPDAMADDLREKVALSALATPANTAKQPKKRKLAFQDDHLKRERQQVK